MMTSYERRAEYLKETAERFIKETDFLGYLSAAYESGRLDAWDEMNALKRAILEKQAENEKA